MYRSYHINNNQFMANHTAKDFFLLSIFLFFLLSHCFLHLKKDESTGICPFYHLVMLDSIDFFRFSALSLQSQ